MQCTVGFHRKVRKLSAGNTVVKLINKPFKTGGDRWILKEPVVVLSTGSVISLINKVRSNTGSCSFTGIPYTKTAFDTGRRF